MREKIKTAMLDVITNMNGISDKTMLMRVMGQLGPAAFSTDEYLEACQQLLQEGEIFVLKYTDPTSPDRAKTLMFGKGTVFINLGEINGQSPTTSQTDLVRTSSSDL